MKAVAIFDTIFHSFYFYKGGEVIGKVIQRVSPNTKSLFGINIANVKNLFSSLCDTLALLDLYSAIKYCFYDPQSKGVAKWEKRLFSKGSIIPKFIHSVAVLSAASWSLLLLEDKQILNLGLLNHALIAGFATWSILLSTEVVNLTLKSYEKKTPKDFLKLLGTISLLAFAIFNLADITKVLSCPTLILTAQVAGVALSMLSIGWKLAHKVE